MLLSFIFAFFSTMGFCILFHVPKKHILLSSFVGGCGWLIYTYFNTMGISKVLACFIGACAVAFLSGLFAKFFKEATTIYTIPGILPLVPGAGMYYTMLAILEGDLQKTASVGIETLLMAGAISVALLVIASLFNLVSLAGKKN